MSLSYQTITTPRLTTAYLASGTPGKPRLLLLHGNVSSAIFYEHMMELLAEDFEMLAPDFRCFGHSSALPIDATRGLRDFSDDIEDFVRAVGWDHFSLFGWSMGGGVAMQYAIDHPEKVERLILQAPLAPFGFGGSYGETGIPVQPVGLGSGAACANQALLQAIRAGDRDLPGQVIDSVYVAAGYKLPDDRREQFIDSVLQCKLGDDMCQGNTVPCEKWPYAMGGDKGVSNTMSVQYCNLSALADVRPQMPILWLHGDKDVMVSDCSTCDVAVLGQMGFMPGYPGAEEFPAQPMVKQMRYVLEQYHAKGGYYQEHLIAGSGHGCMLDHEDEVVALLRQFIH